MKLILAIVLSLFATVASADPVADHKKALRDANNQFIVAFEQCESEATVKARNKCRGVAKAQHTKAVEKADRALGKS